MSPVLPVAALVVAGYLSGSLLGAVWVCRALGRRDPRYAGSRNPGFSNVLRVHGAVPAALTLTVDAVKAMPVLWVAQREALPLWLQGAVGLSVLVGHSYPAWHCGRGGKAVASAFGVLLMIATPVAWVCALCWAILAWRSRTAAVASLAAALLAPLASYWLAREATLVVSVFSALVLVRHAWNIRRLGQGGEPGLARSSREEDGDVRPPEG